ncbi:MAG: TonB-dependent receptor, partial [Ferruginibacter sp.]
MNFKICLVLLFFFPIVSNAQEPVSSNFKGIIGGNILDAESREAIEGSTVTLLIHGDTTFKNIIISDVEGSFLFGKLSPGYYKVQFKMSGYTSLLIDSIYIRTERFDFNLADTRLTKSGTQMSTVIVYAEKPLYENKDGKLTFNASESALSNGASITDLLKQTPLVNVDQDGKVLLRGKDVKILIDDKPVDLDARQLQDLLESMPGSMIEKIEVLTTPPPQFANERGGVINIVTKKGKVGVSGRLNANYGTRGEAGFSISGNYRKNGFTINASAGFSYNKYRGESYTSRQNIYADSVNFFNTSASSITNNRRPNGRLAIDYDADKFNSFSFSFLYNSSNNLGESNTQYNNINRYEELYRLSLRKIESNQQSYNPSFNLSYTRKAKDPRKVLSITSNLNLGKSNNGRNFFQQFLNPADLFIFADSLQEQNTIINNRTANVRINYDRPIMKKLSISAGSHFNSYMSHNRLSTLYMKRPENIFIE